MQRTARLLAVIAALCASALSTAALAQKYPVRPVKIMVGFSAGGPVDVVARASSAIGSATSSGSPSWSRTAPAPTA